MDIETFSPEDYEDAMTGRVVIKDPLTGQPTSMVWIMAGPENPIRKKIDLDKQRRARAAFQKTGKLQFQDPLEEEEDETEKLAACTLGIEGYHEPFSKELPGRLLRDSKRRWLRSQVKAGFDERELFIVRSAKP